MVMATRGRSSRDELPHLWDIFAVSVNRVFIPPGELMLSVFECRAPDDLPRED